MNRRRGVALLALVWAAAAPGPAVAQRAEGAPAAQVGTVVDTYHGVAVADPYRQLENVKDPEVQAWMKAQSWVMRVSSASVKELSRNGVSVTP